MADELKGKFLKLTNSDIQISLDKVANEKNRAAVESEKFQKIFDFFDKDKNGTLSQDEIADLIEKITAAAMKNGNMDVEDDEIRELLETTTNSEGKTLLDEGIDVNELFSFVKTLETDETEETNPTDETIDVREPDTSIDENGNEVTDYCEGDMITKRVIKSTDEQGNVTETTLEFQEGKVVRKQIVKNGNTISTSTYSYNDQDGNQSVSIETENADRSTVTTNVSAVDASGDYAENNFISRHTTKIDGTTIDVEYTDNGMTSTTTSANGEMSSSVYSQKSITAFDNNELKEVSSRTIALENGKIVVTQRFRNSVIKEYYNGNNISEFSAANPGDRQLVKQIILGLNDNNQAQELTRYANGSYSVRVFNSADDYDNNAEPIEQYTITTLDNGENLSNLAKKYQTTVDAILAANGDINNPNNIGIERSIRIPAYNDELTAQRASFAQARNKAVAERAGNAETMIYMSQQATLELSSNYSSIEDIARYIVKNVYNTEGINDKQIGELVNSLDYSLTLLNGSNAADALKNINKNHKVSYPVQLTGKHKTVVDTLQSIGINPTRDNQRIYQAAHALISQDEAEGSTTKNYDELMKLLKSEQAKNNPEYVTQSLLKNFGINSYSDSKKLYDDIKKSGHPQLALLEKCGMDLANPYDQGTLVRIYNYCEALANAQEGSLERDAYDKLTAIIQSALKKHKDSIPKSDSFALTLDNGKLTESEMIALKRDVYLSLGIDLFAKGELDWRTEQKLKTAQKKILTASVLSNVYSSLAQIYAHKNDGSFVGTVGTLIEKGINLIDDDAFTTDDQKAERYQQYAERYAAMADVSTWGTDTPLDGPYINALGAGISLQSKDLDKLLEYCSEHSDNLDIWNDKKFIELFEKVHGTPIISDAKSDCNIDSWITGVGDIAATIWVMGKMAPLFEFIAPEASVLATSSRGGKIAATILGNIKITPIENGKYRIEYPDNRTVTYNSYEEAYSHINNYYEEALIYNTLEEGLNNENVIEIDENSRMEKTSNGYRVVLSNGKSYEASSVREAMERANSEYTHLTNEATLRKCGKLKLSENFEITFDEANNAYRGRLNGVEFEASSMDDAIQKATIKATATEIEKQFKKSDKIKTFDNITVERLAKNKGYKLTFIDADGTVRVHEGRTLEEALEKVYNRTVETPVPTPLEQSGLTVGDRTFRYEAQRDSDGRVIGVDTDIDCVFSPELTENISEFDILCALGETDGHTVFTPEIRASRNLELVREINDSQTGVSANIYRKGNQILLSINGWHGTPQDVLTGMHVNIANAHHLPINATGLHNLNRQLTAIDKIYSDLKAECDANGQNLVVAGYSLGGALTRFIANNHLNDNSTRFVTFNAYGTGKRSGREVESYAISGDKKSNGKGLSFTTATKGTTVVESTYDKKHDLEAFLFTESSGTAGTDRETSHYESDDSYVNAVEVDDVKSLPKGKTRLFNQFSLEMLSWQGIEYTIENGVVIRLNGSEGREILGYTLESSYTAEERLRIQTYQSRLHSIIDNDYVDVDLLRNLTPSERAELRAMLAVTGDNTDFALFSTGAKPAAYINDSDIFDRIDNDNFDIVRQYPRELPNGRILRNAFVINKSQVKEIISNNRDIYINRMGLSADATVDDIYRYLLSEESPLKKEDGSQDVIGLTLGYPRMSTIIYALENMGNVNAENRYKVDLTDYKQDLLTALYSENSPYRNMSQDFKAEVETAIKSITEIKQSGLVLGETSDGKSVGYYFMQFVDEPAEVQRIKSAVDIFIEGNASFGSDVDVDGGVTAPGKHK